MRGSVRPRTERRVIVRLSLNSAYVLFSHTNTIGRSQIAARLSDSWKDPWLTAPSPKNDDRYPLLREQLARQRRPNGQRHAGADDRVRTQDPDGQGPRRASIPPCRRRGRPTSRTAPPSSGSRPPPWRGRDHDRGGSSSDSRLNGGPRTSQRRRPPDRARCGRIRGSPRRDRARTPASRTRGSAPASEIAPSLWSDDQTVIAVTCAPAVLQSDNMASSAVRNYV